jgi:[acyl-carrier-protein] S-malonyltransferase
MVAVVSPGQGAQSPGMLEPWLDAPGARDAVRRWSELAELDLLEAGTTWPADRIRDTAVAQPLLTAAALLSARALLQDVPPRVVCGHSIGELTALALAGVVNDDEAVTLAAQRGRAMAAAAGLAETGMSAVLGGDADEITAAATALGLEVANVNVAGQIVVGGPTTALQAFAAAPPAGARVRPLEVAGAFHTSAMAPATEAFAAALAGLAPKAPQLSLLGNADGAVVPTGEDAVRRLQVQLTSPVRFDLCLATIGGLGCTGVIELAPAGTLTALAKRALPDVERVALRTPDDLPAARALLSLSKVPA